MKEYTSEQRADIAKRINTLIEQHDGYEIRMLCKEEEYALYYFVSKALDGIQTLNHIREIAKEK